VYSKNNNSRNAIAKMLLLEFFFNENIPLQILERNVCLLVILRLAINRKERKCFTLYYADKQKVRKAFY